jgi:hypothetical protein
MRTSPRLVTRRAATPGDRDLVLAVLAATYRDEKAWVADIERQFPLEDLASGQISWFITTLRGEPVGVVRVLYDPPIQTYMEYGLKPIDGALDVAAFIRNERIAEVGRFAVVATRRRHAAVSMSLISAASGEIIERGYTQLITDVFEGDPHSPYRFHTRIIGFKPVATHEIGELAFKGRRITMVLDVRAAYVRLKSRGNLFFRLISRGWSPKVHARFA